MTASNKLPGRERFAAADAAMGAALRATYAQMDDGTLPHEQGITELGRIADEHRAACDKVRAQGGAR
ncbi:hypothetical protein ACQSSU_06795 [Micromonospora echinospora]